MTPILITLSGDEIYFESGKFDPWCVYLKRNGFKPYAPLDTEYFSFFYDLAKQTSTKMVYDVFVRIYSGTTGIVSSNVIEIIKNESKQFGEKSKEAEIWFGVIYGAMIAEENKKFAILKKRIKRLGLHQVLFGNMSINDAANWSKGKKWKEIDAECRGFGF